MMLIDLTVRDQRNGEQLTRVNGPVPRVGESLYVQMNNDGRYDTFLVKAVTYTHYKLGFSGCDIMVVKK